MAKKVIAKKAPPANMAAVTDERPDWVDEDSARGSEDVSIDDVVLPRIDVLQDLSPQLKANKPEYIEDSAPGMLFNVVTKQLYGSSVVFVPVYFNKVYIIWKDRNSGGGLRGIFDTEEEAVAAKVALDDGAMCDIVDTAQHYGLLVGENSIEQVVFAMSKSKMKVSRQLNTLVRVAGGDRFSRAYKVEAIEDSGPKGEFWNVRLTQMGYVSKDVYDAAEEMYEAIKSGQRSVNYSDPDAESESAGESEY